MNAADPKQVKSAVIIAQSRRDQELNDLRVLLSMQEGKRFFARMFAFGQIEDEVYTGNSGTFFNCGMRKFALKYWNDVKEADVDAFTEIIGGRHNG